MILLGWSEETRIGNAEGDARVSEPALEAHVVDLLRSLGDPRCVACALVPELVVDGRESVKISLRRASKRCWMACLPLGSSVERAAKGGILLRLRCRAVLHLTTTNLPCYWSSNGL